MKTTDDRLSLEQSVIIDGGVTEEHLRTQLRRWRGFMAAVAAPCRRMQAEADD